MASPFSPFQFGDSFSPFLRPSTGAIDPEFQSGINAEKLGGAWSVGTEFHVTDGFVVSGEDGPHLGFYVSVDSDTYQQTPPNSDPNFTYKFVRAGGAWVWGSLDSPNIATVTCVNPWDGADWSNAYGAATLTHPAVQTLVAPSSDQGGVVVLGGAQDGVYTKQNDQYNGKDYFNLLGKPQTDPTGFVVSWSTQSPVHDDITAWWIIGADASTLLYYSLSDVTDPSLATDWKNASDDTPASISVGSVTEGELYAGLRVTNDGATNGSSYGSQPFHGRQYYMGLNGGGSNNLHWDTDYNVWTDDVGEWTSSNVAFPWQGVDNGGGHTGATFARNDVANEQNWQNS